jgi:dissimilatory sulfite reductase (desulfoviridin) alpha/beta subunit
MGVMDTMMDMMIKTISKEKREQMMINMMPQMMEGLDIYEFMPKMMTDMLKDVTVDDVIAFIKRVIEEQDKLAGKSPTLEIYKRNIKRQGFLTRQR